MRLQIEREWHLVRYRDTGPRCMLSLSVEGGGAKFMQVLVPFSVAEQIAPRCKEDDLSPLTDPLMLLLLDRLRHMGEEGMAPLLRTVGEIPTYVFEVSEGDVPLARRLTAGKSCRYQESQKRELFCTAAFSLEARDVVVTPTTHHRCGACWVPDDRLVCSNFSHARVLHLPQGNDPISARCEVGRGEIKQNCAACRPGGHACWERELDFEQPADEPQHALALHELFEFVDARWKAALGRHLISSRRGMAFGKLAIPCQTSADLEAKLSALAHVMKGFEVADDLLKEEHRGQSEYKPGSSLNRTESALERVLAEDPDTVAVVKRAIAVLREANALRNDAVHGGRDVVSRLASFGVPYPPPPAPETWARIQSSVAKALHDLADAIADE